MKNLGLSFQTIVLINIFILSYKNFKRCVSFASAYVNDPSAGSPTETLLRLLLPLNDQVWSSSRHNRQRITTLPRTSPKTSLNHSIGSSDGRCVQRAGT